MGGATPLATVWCCEFGVEFLYSVTSSRAQTRSESGLVTSMVLAVSAWEQVASKSMTRAIYVFILLHK